MFVLLRQKMAQQVDLGFPQIKHFPNKFFTSSSSSKQEAQAFTVSYFMKSCGFSLENAVSASKKVHFKTPDKPDAVLELIRNHGFTNTQISKVLNTRPASLAANPEKTFMPKFGFLESLGLSKAAVVKIVTSNPSVLAYSLKKHIIPLCEFIRKIVGSDENVGIVLKNCPMILKHDPRKHLGSNVEVLVSHGVPESLISRLLKRNAGCLLKKCDEFEECVKEVVRKGFSPSTYGFTVALQVISTMTESTWNRKVEAYKRWGWEELDFQVAFRTNPLFMSFSEEKITDAMEVLVNEMGFKSDAIARNPSVLGHNLEKRIIPRCSVMKILAKKGLVKKGLALGSYLFPSDEYFLNNYVIKYEKNAPELLRIFTRGAETSLKKRQ